MAIVAVSVIYIWGCKKDLDPQQGLVGSSALEAAERDGDGSTVLGQQRTIPYKVDVVKQAYNNLYEPDIANLSANYLYVRFLPQDPQDVKKLLDSGIECWDMPLDYDAFTWGEQDHDASTDDTALSWQYAVVEARATLPSVQYEVLEQLALVPEDCAIAQEAFRLTGNAYDAPDQFEGNPGIVNGTFDYQIEREATGGDGGGGGGDCSCPLPDHTRKPSGCVQVFDNMLNQWEGVINVEVHTSKSHIFGVVFHRETETDENGCWKINHKYNGKIHVWVKWENSTCDVKTMEGNFDLWGYSFPRKAYMGSFSGPNHNNISIKFDFTNAIGSWNFRNWVASTINNAVFEFAEFVTDQEIPRTVPGNLKILVTPWGSGNNTGAAPMLDKMGAVQQFILATPAKAILIGIFGVVSPVNATLLLPLATWLEVTAPDISINVNTAASVNADDIREITYHELSHALHFSQVGSTYWLENIAYVILNGGYGDGSSSGAGRCAVIEAWGFQIGMNAAHLRYGGNNSNPGTPATNTWRAILERDWGEAFIPFGWEWDLQDDNTTNPANETENATVTDRVFGISNAQIFSKMTSNMTSMPQMKTAIAPLLPSGVPTSAYNTLSMPYGF